jgi:hypothetical protein
MLKKNLRKGGYIAPYSSSPNSTEYMLNSSVNNDAIANINYANNKADGPEIYVPPSTTSTATLTPGIRGGSNKKANRMQLNDVFYYSMDGGCACNSGGSSKNNKKKGGDFVLTPFISALALLGARMLADKNSGFKMSELMSTNNSKTVGGSVRRRQLTSRRNGGYSQNCSRGASC